MSHLELTLRNNYKTWGFGKRDDIDLMGYLDNEILEISLGKTIRVPGNIEDNSLAYCLIESGGTQ